MSDEATIDALDKRSQLPPLTDFKAVQLQVPSLCDARQSFQVGVASIHPLPQSIWSMDTLFGRFQLSIAEHYSFTNVVI